MQLKKLRQMIGDRFRFIPTPHAETASGATVMDRSDWILLEEKQDEKGFRFTHSCREGLHFTLHYDLIRNFDEPKNLLLWGQVTIKDSEVVCERIRPEPAPLSPRTSLVLSLDDYRPEERVERCAVYSTPLEVFVTNNGHETVRDYRITLLIPADFTRMSAVPFTDDFSAEGKEEFKDWFYHRFTTSRATPIYAGLRLRIGELPLTAPPGDYEFYWQIHSDEGVSPGDDFGSIDVTVRSLSDLGKEAMNNLAKEAQEGTSSTSGNSPS